MHRSLWFRMVSATVALTTVLQAQSVDPIIEELDLFGVNRVDGRLMRYNFAAQEVETIGNVHTATATALIGIDASAYVPGFHNIFAFWPDPSDELTKLVYVDPETAEAAVLEQDLGPGAITGAVATIDPDGGVDVEGILNINPNNSGSDHTFMLVETDRGLTLKINSNNRSHNPSEFVLTRTNETDITQIDLHQESPVDDYGVYYEGAVTHVQVKPNGKGNQNGLLVNGVPYALKNSEIYDIKSNAMSVRLYNDHINGKGKAMGKWWADITASNCVILKQDDPTHSDTAAEWSIVAVQEMEAPDVDFDIDDDTVVPTEPFAAKVTILGASIRYGGYYDIPVTVKLKIDNQSFTPFGSFDLAMNGNVNDGQNSRSFVFPDIYPGGTPIDVLGRSWIKRQFKYSGSSDSHWKVHITVDGSNTNSPQVIVLRDGSDVPDIPGFHNQNSIKACIPGFIEQNSITACVGPYIDSQTNKIKLDPNQAIFLCELGMTNLASPAADFQDLIVLITLAKNVEDLANDPPVGEAHPPARLIRVDHQSGEVSELLPLSRLYDGLGCIDESIYLASFAQQLYQIDTDAGTESLVGSMVATDTLGLEFAGSTLFGFEIVDDTLVPVDDTSGAAVGTPATLGLVNLGTIVFVPARNLVEDVAYD